MPTTKLGRWSAWFILTFFFFLVATQVVIATGQRGGETILDNLWISVPVVLAFLAAVLGFVTGLTSILKQHERAVLVWISTGIGLLVMFFLIGEIASPE